MGRESTVVRAAILFAVAIAAVGLGACTTTVSGHPHAPASTHASAASFALPRPWRLSFTERGTDGSGHPYTDHYVEAMTVDPAVHDGFRLSFEIGGKTFQSNGLVLTPIGQYEDESAFPGPNGPAQKFYDPPGLQMMRFPLAVGQSWTSPHVVSRWYRAGTRVPYPTYATEIGSFNGQVVAAKVVTFQGRRLAAYVVDTTETGVTMNGNLVSSNYTETIEWTYVPTFGWALSLKATDALLLVSGQYTSKYVVQADGLT